MSIPRCTDGTHEHTWIAVEESASTRIDRCAVCGQGRITTRHTGHPVVRYRRGYQPWPAVTPDGIPPPGFARTGTPVPQTRAERQREQIASIAGKMRGGA